MCVPQMMPAETLLLFKDLRRQMLSASEIAGTTATLSAIAVRAPAAARPHLEVSIFKSKDQRAGVGVVLQHKMETDPCWRNIADIFQKRVRAKDIRRALEQRGDVVGQERDHRIDDNVHAIQNTLDRGFPEQNIPVKATVREAINIFHIVNASDGNTNRRNRTDWLALVDLMLVEHEVKTNSGGRLFGA